MPCIEWLHFFIYILFCRWLWYNRNITLERWALPSSLIRQWWGQDRNACPKFPKQALLNCSCDQQYHPLEGRCLHHSLTPGPPVRSPLLICCISLTTVNHCLCNHWWINKCTKERIMEWINQSVELGLLSLASQWRQHVRCYVAAQRGVLIQWTHISKEQAWRKGPSHRLAQHWTAHAE